MFLSQNYEMVIAKFDYEAGVNMFGHKHSKRTGFSRLLATLASLVSVGLPEPISSIQD